MNSWLIKLENKETKAKLTIYENGLVYGTEKNEKVAILSPSAIEQIKDIINENMYMFKKLVYYNEKLNPWILRINDTSRKKRNIKIVGWSQTPKIKAIILNPNNHIKVF